MPINLEFLKHVDLTPEEKKFIADSNTAVVADMNQSRIVSDLYFSKTIEQCVARQIASNKELSDSNEKYDDVADSGTNRCGDNPSGHIIFLNPRDSHAGFS